MDFSLLSLVTSVVSISLLTVAQAQVFHYVGKAGHSDTNGKDKVFRY